MTSPRTPHQELENYFSCLLADENQAIDSVEGEKSCVGGVKDSVKDGVKKTSIIERGQASDVEGMADNIPEKQIVVDKQKNSADTSSGIDQGIVKKAAVKTEVKKDAHPLSVNQELDSKGVNDNNGFKNNSGFKDNNGFSDSKPSKDKAADNKKSDNYNASAAIIPPVLSSPSAISVTERSPEATASLSPQSTCDIDAVENIAYQLQQQRLQKLLQEVTAKPVNTEVSTKTDIQTEGQTTIEVDSKTKTNSLTAEAISPVEADNTLDQPQAIDFAPLSSEWLDNGRPCWAQERFDILLVEVGGLKLAVPLESLGQIKEMDDELTPLFGQADWFMGLQKTSQGNIRTVNTAKYMMPERYEEHHLDQLNYIVSINGLPWGLAVDAIDQPVSIDPDNIRWRAKRSERPWMAGTVKDHMCVLLDIPVLGELLSAQDANKGS